MPPNNWPRARYRIIGAELKQMRLDCGMTMRTAVRKSGYSAGWFSTMENGRSPVNSDELEDLFTLYGIPEGPQRENLRYLVKRARARDGWWRAFKGQVPPSVADYASVEAEAASIAEYEPDMIPGLYQTREYARKIITPDQTPAALRANKVFLEFRVNRQQILSRENPPRIHSVIGEAALRQLVGDAAGMNDQLIHLEELAGRDHIVLQVLPFSAGPHHALGQPFTILDILGPAAFSVVAVETLVEDFHLQQPEEIQLHRDYFEVLQAMALDAAESVAFMQAIRSELWST
jgi:transcriptional regulator with XRE-family HTH domain